MKKLLIIMLSLLVIFSFVSCDSNKAQSENSEKAAEQTTNADKTEENLANIKEFVAAYRHYYQITNIIKYHLNYENCANALKSTTGLVIPSTYVSTGSSTNESEYYSHVGNYLDNIYADLSKKDIKDLSVTTASGTLTGNYDSGEYTITATGVKYNFTYTVDGDSTANGTDEINLSGTFTYKADSENKLYTSTGDFYVNDTHYVITYTCGVSSSAIPEFKSATINGNTVDVRFINAAIDAVTMIGA
jgi:hypothetical protein